MVNESSRYAKYIKSIGVGTLSDRDIEGMSVCVVSSSWLPSGDFEQMRTEQELEALLASRQRHDSKCGGGSIHSTSAISEAILEDKKYGRYNPATIFLKGTLRDPRMGVESSSKASCETCQEKKEFCPGHFGVIRLQRWIFGINSFNITKMLLGFFCPYCRSLLFSKEELEELFRNKGIEGLYDDDDDDNPSRLRSSVGKIRTDYSLDRLKLVSELCKKKTHCSSKNALAHSTGYGLKTSLESEDEEGNSSSSSSENEPLPQQRSDTTTTPWIDSKEDEDDARDTHLRGCERMLPKIKQSKNRPIFVADFSRCTDRCSDEEPLQDLTATYAFEVFHSISDEMALLLGFDPTYSHPRNLLHRCIPVPPPSIRPTYLADSSSKSESDLTKYLVKILQQCERIEKLIQSQAIETAIEHVQDNIQLLFNEYVRGESKMGGLKFRSVIASSSKDAPQGFLKNRLEKKEGRIRGNLMGKRVDHCARTVIGPDPCLKLDEVGIPRSIALNLTIPERVSRWNIARLQRLVNAGPYQYPGARIVKRSKSGGMVSVGDTFAPRDDEYDLKRISTGAFRIRMGDVVERHIQNGDPVVVNRQPSLHKMSMMGHRVKVLPYSTFRLNLSVTTPYNADFDGDEMNIHVPQSLEASTEILNLMMVKQQIAAPQSNKPCMGVVQDALVGAHLMSLKNTFLERDQVMNLMMWMFDDHDNHSHSSSSSSSSPIRCGGAVPRPAIIKPKPLWTGKQILSLIIPEHVYLEMFNNSGGHTEQEHHPSLSLNESWVKIHKGELLCGRLDKKIIGASAGGLIHYLCATQSSSSSSSGSCASTCSHSGEDAGTFIERCQLVVNQWLLEYGFSVGIGDLMVDEKTLANVDATIDEGIKKAHGLFHQYCTGKLQKIPGQTSARQTFEHHTRGVLDSARDASGKHVLDDGGSSRNYQHPNALHVMVASGSKGSAINISQISGCVGQQSVEGNRIGFGFCERTLPHCHRHTADPVSRGFVRNSYLRGLTPEEFFFHAMGGREGVTDTAIKTSTTGYIQRRIVKANEDTQVHYDGTVRNSRSEVIQFRYGDDGMDASRVEFQRIDFLSLSNEDFDKKYLVDDKWISDHPWSSTTTTDGDDDDSDGNGETASHYYYLLSLHKKLKQGRKYILSKRVIDIDSGSCPLPVHVDRLIQVARRVSEPIWSRISKLDKHSGGGNGMKDLGVYFDPLAASVERSKYTLYVDQIIAGLQVLEKMIRSDFGNGETTTTNDESSSSNELFLLHLWSKLHPKRVLGEYHLTKIAFEELIDSIKRKYISSRAQPGESVGMIASQSIGEPATQMTLNTFHLAGVGSKNVTLGIPRLQEVLNVSKVIRTPSMTVKLDPSIRTLEDQCMALRRRFVDTNIKDVCDSISIWFEPKFSQTVIPSDRVLVEEFYEFMEEDEEYQELVQKQHTHRLPWIIRVVLHRPTIMANYIINGLPGVSTIKDAICAHIPNAHCEYSSDNDDAMIIRIHVFSDKPLTSRYDDHGSSPSMMMATELQPPSPPRFYSSPLSGDDDDDDDESAHKSITQDTMAAAAAAAEQPTSSAIIVRDPPLPPLARRLSPEEFQISDNQRKTMEDLVRLIPRIPLGGIPGISDASMREISESVEDPQTGALIKQKSFILETQGTNLCHVMALPGVDPFQTLTNDIHETFRVLGIEATRTLLIREITGILSFDGSYVNSRHISLLVDEMTRMGSPLPVTRHGLKKTTAGIFQMCSFEETLGVLSNASALGGLDPLVDVSGSIMVGKLARIGTGLIDVILDTDALLNWAPVGQMDSTLFEYDSAIYDETDAVEFSFFPDTDNGLPSSSSSVTTAEGTPSYYHDHEHNMMVHGGGYQPMNSPSYGSFSPSYNGAQQYSPFHSSPSYGGGGQSYHATPSSFSPAYHYSPQSSSSPLHAYQPLLSPAYNPSGRHMGGRMGYSPSSPGYDGGQYGSSYCAPNRMQTSPYSTFYQSASPAYSPSSPRYSPSYNPSYGQFGASHYPSYGSSPCYSPSIHGGPGYSPSSPGYNSSSRNRMEHRNYSPPSSSSCTSQYASQPSSYSTLMNLQSPLPVGAFAPALFSNGSDPNAIEWGLHYKDPLAANHSTSNAFSIHSSSITPHNGDVSSMISSSQTTRKIIPIEDLPLLAIRPPNSYRTKQPPKEDSSSHDHNGETTQPLAPMEGMNPMLTERLNRIGANLFQTNLMRCGGGGGGDVDHLGDLSPPPQNDHDADSSVNDDPPLEPTTVAITATTTIPPSSYPPPSEWNLLESGEGSPLCFDVEMSPVSPHESRVFLQNDNSSSESSLISPQDDYEDLCDYSSSPLHTLDSCSNSHLEENEPPPPPPSSDGDETSSSSSSIKSCSSTTSHQGNTHPRQSSPNRNSRKRSRSRASAVVVSSRVITRPAENRRVSRTIRRASAMTTPHRFDRRRRRRREQQHQYTYHRGRDTSFPKSRSSSSHRRR